MPLAAGRWRLSRLALLSVVSLLFLSSSAHQVDSAELQWSRPSAPRRTPQRRAANPETNHHRVRAVRDSAVVAAIWKEDDAFVASLVETAQAAEDRSVVVRRSPGPTMPSGERFAQRPEDPFEQTVDESLPQLEIEDPPIEEVERAIEREFDRRQSEQDLREQELFEEEALDAQPEVAEADPFDEPVVEQSPEPTTPEQETSDAPFEETEGAIEQEVDSRQLERDLFGEPLEGSDPLESDDISDLFDEDLMEDESDESMLFEDEKDDLDLELESDKESSDELADEEQDEMIKERQESEKNCEEEIAKLRARRIDDIDLSIRLEGNAGEDFPFECTLDSAAHQPRCWPLITYNWKAAALCHKPLYFEQVHLERYGHSWGPYVQPIMSGVHFFGTLPVLPYKMGIRTPTECVYTLGYYRPGSCAPYMIDPIPFTWRAALLEAGVATGISFVLP